MRPAPVVAGWNLHTGQPVMHDPMVYHRGLDRPQPVSVKEHEEAAARIVARLKEAQMVRGKFTVREVTHVDWNKDARRVKLMAVADDGTPENERYARFTPSGEITITIDNPPASDQLVLGKTFYVDFTPAE